jgi:hypothetical protein
VGSNFDIPIILNTNGHSINGIQVRINFDSNKLTVIKPSSSTSIIGVWVEPPVFDNVHGTASYVGVVPKGIVTGSGLVGTITFRAKAPGVAVVKFRTDSKVLLNDGLGTDTLVEFGRAEYNILPKAPEGVDVFSETHPFQTNWYNNRSPIVSWSRDPGVDGFSYVLDNMPSTIPQNVINSTDTTKALENLSDGLWYFHIKSHKNGVWGAAGHFLLKIDTTPPADFKPEASYLVSAVILVDRTLITFFTTDNLSGVDHYEVGIIDKSQPITESPVFVQAESPFQVPLTKDGNLRVIVRAVDKAGNVRDASIDVVRPFIVTKFIKDYLVYILIFIILAGLVGLIAHYTFGRHLIRYFVQLLSRYSNAVNGEKIIDDKKTKGVSSIEDTNRY